MKKINLILGLMAIAAAGMNVDAMEDSGIENQQTIQQRVQTAAEQGHDEAQYRLGNMYRTGIGVAPDFETAIHWYELAAEQGNANAQYHLGDMYREGLGVAPDFEKATHWYELAAEQGNANAQYHLGNMYRKGLGVEPDLDLAACWYRFAAEQGLVQAQLNLGDMYRNGLGVAQDLEEANRWYRRATEQGFIQAHNSDDTLREMVDYDILTGQAPAEYIGREEFQHIDITDIELVDTREIGIGAFECSPNLTSVAIKSFNRPAIRAFAFGDCPNLRQVEFFGVPGEIASNTFGEHQNNGISPEFLDTRIIIHGERDETVHQQLLDAGIREENITWLDQ